MKSKKIISRAGIIGGIAFKRNGTIWCDDIETSEEVQVVVYAGIDDCLEIWTHKKKWAIVWYDNQFSEDKNKAKAISVAASIKKKINPVLVKPFN